VRTGATLPASGKPLQLALSAAFVSEKGTAVYKDIASYMAAKLGQPCEVISGLSYGTINQGLEKGTLDMAFVCGLPYVMLHDRPQPAAHLVVAPVMHESRYRDRPKYFSDLIVRKDSRFRSFADLQGCRYVYNDELSNSGYNMPRHRLVTAQKTAGFFGRVLRSGSHEESIRMVATGEADASYVDSLVIDYDRAKHPEYASQVRVVESLGPAGICPLVCSAKISEEMRTRIQSILKAMHQTPEGKRILEQALVTRFDAVGDDNYDDIRKMKTVAETAGFRKIK
jgi:phosphonate transport system substrate-binding protein